MLPLLPSGIGLETAKEFLKLGASVVIISRSPSDVDTVVRELNAAVAPWVGGAPAPAGAAPGASAAVEAAVAVTTAAVATAPAARVFGCPCDVSSDAGRTALVAFVEGTWGGALDVLINNVGVTRIGLDSPGHSARGEAQPTHARASLRMCSTRAHYWPARRHWILTWSLHLALTCRPVLLGVMVAVAAAATAAVAAAGEHPQAA